MRAWSQQRMWVWPGRDAAPMLHPLSPHLCCCSLLRMAEGETEGRGRGGAEREEYEIQETSGRQKQ